MTYTVIWRRVLLDRLADFYTAADVPDRERMSAGVEALNEKLADDPSDVGESRAGGDRIAFPPLLAVTFTINPADRVVRVTGLARYGR
jgi:hypothetical protein